MVIRHWSERHAIAIEIPPNCMSVLDSFYFKKYQKLAKDTLWIPGSRISKDLRHFRPCYKTWINKKKTCTWVLRSSGRKYCVYTRQKPRSNVKSPHGIQNPKQSSWVVLERSRLMFQRGIGKVLTLARERGSELRARKGGSISPLPTKLLWKLESPNFIGDGLAKDLYHIQFWWP